MFCHFFFLVLVSSMCQRHLRSTRFLGENRFLFPKSFVILFQDRKCERWLPLQSNLWNIWEWMHDWHSTGQTTADLWPDPRCCAYCLGLIRLIAPGRKSTLGRRGAVHTGFMCLVFPNFRAVLKEGRGSTGPLAETLHETVSSNLSSHWVTLFKII